MIACCNLSSDPKQLRCAAQPQSGIQSPLGQTGSGSWRRGNGQAPLGMPGAGSLPTTGPGLWGSIGAQLYSGRAPFANGGMACSGCHAVNGYGVAPPLAEIAHEKRGNRLLPFLQNPENTAMRQAYSGHPITGPEAQALSSYFASIGGGSEGEHEGRWRGHRRHGNKDGDD